MSNPSRQPKGTPTGGQFATSAHAEADGVALTGERPEPTAAEVALGHRLAAYERLKEHGCVGTVSTLTWPEEPNEDGTFDVDLTDVYDADGEAVEDIGGEGAEPAGWFDEGAPTGYRTAYDAWREDTEDPESRIDLVKMQAWYADYSRNAAKARLDERTTVDENGRRWVDTEEDFWAAEADRLEAQTPTPFADLKPHDRFVVEHQDCLVECHVLDNAFPTKDMFGRRMQAFMVRRQDNGAEGLHMFGPEGIARKVERPVLLRVDPADQPTEQDLNRAWGV